jgi:GNAT superfamily N-acetyltransferase
MDGKLVFTSLTASDLLSDRSWWEIYDDAFPANEREPPNVIVKSLEMGAGQAFAARVNDETIAIATTHLLKDPPAVFLIYLATMKGLRGRGCGGELLEYAWKTGRQTLFAQGLQATGFVAEVDAPNESDNIDERRVRERRIAFFARHGAELSPRAYTQPAVDGTHTVPMRLVFRPAEEPDNPDSLFTDALVRAIYFEKYHAANGIARESLVSLLEA